MTNQTISVDAKVLSLYMITNLINNKSYIGITSQKPIRRWYCHCSEKSSSITVIKSAILKYGKENFTFSVLATFETKEELKAAEQEYIIKYDTLSPNAFNFKTGGDFPIMTGEAKMRMSEARIKYFDKVGRLTDSYEYVRKRNEDYRRKNGVQTRKDSWKSKQRIQKAKDRMVGFTHTVEAKQKISASKKKPVIRSDGEVFDSIESAAISVNRNKVSLWRVLQGNLGRHTCGGFGWAYLKN